MEKYLLLNCVTQFVQFKIFGYYQLIIVCVCYATRVNKKYLQESTCVSVI